MVSRLLFYPHSPYLLQHTHFMIQELPIFLCKGNCIHLIFLQDMLKRPYEKSSILLHKIVFFTVILQKRDAIKEAEKIKNSRISDE